MTLNGWQRLWTVLVAVWAMAAGVGGYALWPAAVHYSSGEPLTDEELRAVAPELSKNQSLADKLTPDERKRALELGIFVGDAPGVRRVKADDGTIHSFSPNATDAEISAALNAGRRGRIAKYIIRVIGVWAIPAAALYAVGWSCAWVRRGFAEDKQRRPAAEARSRGD